MANQQDTQFVDEEQVGPAVWCLDKNADYGPHNLLRGLGAYLKLVEFGDTFFFKCVEFFDPSLHRLVNIAFFVLVVMAVVWYYVFRKWEDMSEWALQVLSEARVLPERTPRGRRLEDERAPKDERTPNPRARLCSPGRKKR